MKILLDEGAKMPTLPELELVDSLDETDRGDKGFGSTGR